MSDLPFTHGHAWISYELRAQSEGRMIPEVSRIHSLANNGLLLAYKIPFGFAELHPPRVEEVPWSFGSHAYDAITAGNASLLYGISLPIISRRRRGNALGVLEIPGTAARSATAHRLHLLEPNEAGYIGESWVIPCDSPGFKSIDISVLDLDFDGILASMNQSATDAHTRIRESVLSGGVTPLRPSFEVIAQSPTGFSAARAIAEHLAYR